MSCQFRCAVGKRFLRLSHAKFREIYPTSHDMNIRMQFKKQSYLVMTAPADATIKAACLEAALIDNSGEFPACRDAI